MVSEPKKFGELVELRFFMKAIELGFKVSIPFGDSCKYDCIVDDCGFLNRVQIKSTSTVDRSSKNERYRIAASCGGGKKRLYTKYEVDVVAGYITPLNLWYIIPIEDVTGISIGLYPHFPDGLYEKFKEAWYILRQPSRKTKIH